MAKLNDLERLRPLLDFNLGHNRPDINSADEKGWTPLHFASFNGNITIAKLLISSNANVDSENLLGQTPLFITCQR